MNLQYKLIRSGRKTISLEIRGQEILVRAPYSVPKRVIEAFVLEKRDWIEKKLQRPENRQNRADSADLLTEAEISRLYEEASQVLPEMVRAFAAKIGVSYGRITIRMQKTRWGSCSTKGNLNFNCLLMLAPERVQQYVVVHELCHRKEMNHSPAFWAAVSAVFPDYKEQVRWLRKNGTALMQRAGFE